MSQRQFWYACPWFHRLGTQWIIKSKITHNLTVESQMWLLLQSEYYYRYRKVMQRVQQEKWVPMHPTAETTFPWWRNQMETFSALPAFCAGNSSVTGKFPSQRPVARSFDVFFDLQLSKQWRRRWYETSSHSLWHHCNANDFFASLGHLIKRLDMLSMNTLSHGFLVSMFPKRPPHVLPKC